jgi:hypothetical protein
MIGRRLLAHQPHRTLLGGALLVCALALSIGGLCLCISSLVGGGLALGCCADTVQDQPIGPAPLETVLVDSRFPVYWLGLEFRGMQITSVAIDPGGAVTIRYGDCVLGGQYTCVTPVSIVSSPDNSFIPGSNVAAGSLPVRGATASVAQGGATLAIPTGAVVVSVYARNPSLARTAATTMVPINEVGLPGARLQAAAPDTGFDRLPLASEVPPGVSVPRPRGQ